MLDEKIIKDCQNGCGEKSVSTSINDFHSGLIHAYFDGLENAFDSLIAFSLKHNYLDLAIIAKEFKKECTATSGDYINGVYKDLLEKFFKAKFGL